MVLLEFRSKFPKFSGNSWNSSQAHQAFITGFPLSSTGGVWIFSGIAQCTARAQILSSQIGYPVLLHSHEGAGNVSFFLSPCGLSKDVTPEDLKN